ncbi:MAG: Smr/MutS family protein [Rhodocyclaceae bacterium]|nr:Smr/MutS family protein [Rhodocyclaceae bacterium]
MAHVPSPDDIALFHAAVEGTQRLTVDRVHHEPAPVAPRPRSRQRDDAAVLHEAISGPAALDLALEGGDEATFLRPGIAKSVLRDLRRGRWVVQDQIDLHGATRDEAHALLAEFMAHATRRALRCVRVIHGKGLGSPGREPVLKKLVQAWLARREDVLAFCQAKSNEGGAGALRVLVRGQRTGGRRQGTEDRGQKGSR